MFSLNDFGSRISAGVESVMYARTKSAARLRSGGVFALTLGIFALAHQGAMANTFDDYAANISGRTDTMVDVITYIAYIGGAALVALGLVDVKKHVDQPSQNPLKNALGKLGVGGMLLALPFLAGVASDTMKGGDQAQFVDWTATPKVVP